MQIHNLFDTIEYVSTYIRQIICISYFSFFFFYKPLNWMIDPVYQTYETTYITS